MRSPPRLVAFSLIGLATWLAPMIASAQVPTITITTNLITRTPAAPIDRGFDTTKQNRNLWISRDDCLNNVTLQLPIVVSGYSSYELDAFAGSGDCTVSTNVTGGTAICRKVWSSSFASNMRTFTASIEARKLLWFPGRDVSSRDQDPTVTPPPSVCTETSASSGTTALNITFVFVSAGQFQPPAVTWSTSYSLSGPVPPTGFRADPADSMLKVSWTPSTVLALRGYTLFCDPPPGTGSASSPFLLDTDGGAADSADSAPSDADLSDGGLDADAGDAADASDARDASDADADADAADGGDGSVEAGGGDAAVAASCTSSVLVAGTIPSDANLEKNKCGTITGASINSALVNGLVNNNGYAVAIAATDVLGNVGVLSNLSCSTPQRVDDFYSLYKNGGGGGECAVSGVGMNRSRAAVWGGGVLGLALSGWIVRRRRTR